MNGEIVVNAETRIGMKIAVRLVVALFAAIFGSLVVSMQVCTQQSGWQGLADSVCGHNVGRLWIVCALLIFAGIFLLLGQRFTRFRRYAVSGLLSIYAVSSLSDSRTLHSLWVAYPVALLIAAVGVSVGARWARYLVYLASLVFVAEWVYYTWSAVDSGYLRSSPLGIAILSFVPGIAFLIATVFCCYVVTIDSISERAPH